MGVATPKLSIVKKTPAIVQALAASLAEKYSSEVDELGALEKELLPLKPKIARVALLREAIRARYDGAPAAQTAEAHGARFMVMVGARANESVINYPRLIKAIGAKLFGAIAKTTLKALEESVPCAVRADVITIEPIGARSLKTFEKGAPELPKAA